MFIKLKTGKFINMHTVGHIEKDHNPAQYVLCSTVGRFLIGADDMLEIEHRLAFNGELLDLNTCGGSENKVKAEA